MLTLSLAGDQRSSFVCVEASKPPPPPYVLFWLRRCAEKRKKFGSSPEDLSKPVDPVLVED